MQNSVRYCCDHASVALSLTLQIYLDFTVRLSFLYNKLEHSDTCIIR